MKIGIDLSSTVPKINGGWSYARELLRALGAHDRENEYLVYVNGHSAQLVPQGANFRSIPVPVDADSRSVRVRLQLGLSERSSFRHAVDCMHFPFGYLPFSYRGPTLVGFMDLIIFERAKDFPFIRRQFVRNSRLHAVTHATMLAPISKSTADKLKSMLGVSRARMQVVLPAIQDHFAPHPTAEIERFRSARKLPPAFWLYVGQALPHKNHARLAAAHRRVREDTKDAWPLVLCGDSEQSLARASDADASDGSIITLPRLTDEEMPLLYGAASAFIFPSMVEGAGLPVMEAMACGRPVVSADIPTTREFAGNAALTFDPLSTESIARAMRECESSPALREELASRGRQQASRFKPAEIARACVAGYRRAIERAEPGSS
jgi:glycosyltransferase involved in cell wall biosynthesis